MSIFQCDGCGCAENTALSNGGYMARLLFPQELVSKGLDPKGRYCSMCWGGEWHGRFPRVFHPKGTMRTNSVGNLESISDRRKRERGA